VNMTTREEGLLRSIWESAFETLEWSRAFDIDESLPQAVVRTLYPMPEVKDAVLECWRDQMHAAVDEIVQRCKATRSGDAAS
jgi:hypothetical protein